MSSNSNNNNNNKEGTFSPTSGTSKILKHSEEAVVTEWKRKIKLGIAWRERTSGKDNANWKRFASYYRGDWNKGDFSDINDINSSDYLPVNRIFSYIKSILPRVYFRNPGIFVSKGKVVDGIDDKEIIQDYIDYLIKELKLKKTMKRTLLAVFLTGTGITKEGYGSEFVPGEETILPKGKRVEFNSQIKTGLPWVKSVNPAQFVVPWGTKEFDDAPWCAELIYRRLEDAKEDKNYSNRDLIKASSKEGILSNKEYSALDNGDKANWVQLWEVRDKKTGKFMVISEGSSKFHFNDEDVLTKENFPYRVTVFDEDLLTMWGIAVVKIMEPQQLELNDIRTQMSAHRKRECTKWAIDPGALTNGSTMEEINDASKPLAAIIVKKPSENIAVISASMPSDLRPSAEDVDNDIRITSSFSRNQGGDVSTGRRTAREISIAREASEIRNDERRDIASDLFEEIIHDIMLISFDHVSSELVQKITGGVWHSRDTEEIVYDFSLEVNPEEAKPVSSEVSKQEASELYERLIQSPMANPVTPLIDLVKSYGKRNFADYVDPELARVVQTILIQREQAGNTQGRS